MRRLEDILDRARAARRHVVLPEGSDPRVARGAMLAAGQGLAEVTLLGPRDAVADTLAECGGREGPALHILDPATAPRRDDLARLLHELRQAKGITAEAAREAAALPHVHAALMVRAGLADGTLGGAVLATADVVRTALQIIGPAPSERGGPAPGQSLVSSYFLMLFCDRPDGMDRTCIFSDAGLVIDPDSTQLAQIALAAARSYRQLTSDTPRVAMLSFSTHGSAAHPACTKVTEATALARRAAPDLLIDGELQFDAALVPEVARAKAPGSPVAGHANVFVFPNLDAGNIGYKIAQRLGGAIAIGPVLQGLAKPANDLSRGCDAQDVRNMIAVTALQAADLPLPPESAATPPCHEGAPTP